MNGPLLFCLLAALLASAPAAVLADAQANAQANAQERRCRDERSVDRCDPAQQARVRASYQVPTIEAHRDAGDQVRRAFYVNGYGRDQIALSFVRGRGRDPELRVHFYPEPGIPDAPPTVAPVPPDEWQALLDRSALFDRELVSPPEPSGDVIIMCGHGWVFTVEAADPPRGAGGEGSVRRRTENACENGLAEAFAVEMYRAALRLMPICARIGAHRNMHPVSRLADCRTLEGDRLVAATVMNLLDPLLFPLEADGLAQFVPLFHPEASVDWNGERAPAGGGRTAARFFLAKWTEIGRPDFYVESIDAERPDLVRFRGGLVRVLPASGDVPERYESATAEMVWEGGGDYFTIRSARIGPFEPSIIR